MFVLRFDGCFGCPPCLVGHPDRVQAHEADEPEGVVQDVPHHETDGESCDCGQ